MKNFLNFIKKFSTSKRNNFLSDFNPLYALNVEMIEKKKAKNFLINLSKESTKKIDEENLRNTKKMKNVLAINVSKFKRANYRYITEWCIQNVLKKDAPSVNLVNGEQMFLICGNEWLTRRMSETIQSRWENASLIFPANIVTF